MHGRWKFDQKLKNWTWLHMIGFSLWIMKKQVWFDSKIYFMRFGWKWVFTIHDEKLCLMGVDERKSLKFDERMPCVWKMCEKFKFSYLENFFSLHKLRWDEKCWKLKQNPFFSWKSQVNSLLGSPLFLHSQIAQMRLIGSKMKGYIK